MTGKPKSNQTPNLIVLPGEPEDMPSDPLDMMSERFAVVSVGASVRIYDRKADVFRSLADFHALTSHITMTQRSNKTVAVSRVWMTMPDRPTFERVVYVPGGRDIGPDELNLWRGWGVEPKLGDWEQFRNCLLHSVCDGDQRLYDYLVKWLAWGVQNPDRQHFTAMVLHGTEGTGKGLLNMVMATIYGDAHSYHAIQSKDLVGRFNAARQRTSWFYGDEALFARDRSIRGPLKGLITESRISVEAKFVDAQMIDNRLRIMLASNEEHVVPVGVADRRFCIIETSDRYANDKAYFGPIWAQMFDQGGVAAFFHYLLNLDLSAFDPSLIPVTKTKLRHKLETLEPVDRWWLNTLREGTLAHRDGEAAGLWQTGAIEVDFRLLRGSAVDFAKMHSREKITDTALGRALTKYGTRCRKRERGSIRYREIPELSDAREAFAQAVLGIDWAELEATEEGDDE